MIGFTKLAGATLLLAGALLAPAASAESDMDFTIENQTGFTIKELYVSPSKKDKWGKQILKSPMKDGDTRKITFKRPVAGCCPESGADATRPTSTRKASRMYRLRCKGHSLGSTSCYAMTAWLSRLRAG